MELPVFPVFSGTSGSFGELARPRVNFLEREILPDDAHAITVGGADLREYGSKTTAERTLVVGNSTA